MNTLRIFIAIAMMVIMTVVITIFTEFGAREPELATLHMVATLVLLVVVFQLGKHDDD